MLVAGYQNGDMKGIHASKVSIVETSCSSEDQDQGNNLASGMINGDPHS